MSKDITSGNGFLDKHVFIDHAFLCFESNIPKATGLGSTKTPDHPSLVSNSNEFESNSPSNAPASKKKCSLSSVFELKI